MKRNLLILSLMILTAGASLQPAHGFVRPARESLPNLDVRQANPAVNLAPEATAELRSLVPGLQIDMDTVLGAPHYFASSQGFLTGPDGQGLAVKPASLLAVAAADTNRVVKAFLNGQAALLGYDAGILDAAITKQDYITAHNGLRTVVFQQQVDGIPVFEALLTSHITRRGELASLSTYFVPKPVVAADAGVPNRQAVQTAPSVTAAQAVVNAARNLGETAMSLTELRPSVAPQGPAANQKFINVPGLNGETDVRLTWLPMNAGTMRLAWQVILVSHDRGEMYMVLVDAVNGQVLIRRNLTTYAAVNYGYRVYTNNSPTPMSPTSPAPSPAQPAVVARSFVLTSALDLNASPLGWVTEGTTETLGNNVDAHTDRLNRNQPDLPRPQCDASLNFDFPLDLTQDPTNYSAAAVVQLFYWNNWFHDKLYQLGFTEAAGNFQTTNFARGGLGGDPVLSDAQDGGGFNNANMMTPPDGVSPRMQMYIFDGTNPMRDGDLDAEVVLHEHAHGLSGRLVGSGVGIRALQTGGMGEGWSDFYALCLLSNPKDDPNANYATGGYVTYMLMPGFDQNYYFGIRRYPYSTDMSKNPLTFKDIDPTQISAHPGVPLSPLFPFDAAFADEVHNQGEVWCMALWEVRANLVQKLGGAVGNQLMLQLVTDGMKLGPANPNILQARNAILLADQLNTAGANYTEIWAGFAKRGMGSSATSPDSSTTRGVVEAFDLPGIAVVNAVSDDSVLGNNNRSIDFNECNDISVYIRNNGRVGVSNITATLFTTNQYVTISQPTAPYGDLLPLGDAVNLLPFRIYTKPNFPCGSSILFGFIINSMVDGKVETRTNYFYMRSGYLGLTVARFENTTPVAIPDGQTDGVNSIINVTGINDPLGKVVVSFYLTHQYDGDVQAELVSPDGQRVPLVTERGGIGMNFGASCANPTVFDDGALTPIGSGSAPFVGRFNPEYPLSAFGGKRGSQVNGAWRLHIVDAVPGEVGTLQCWSLSLYQTLCTDGGGTCFGDISLQASATPDPVDVNSVLTYTLTVANNMLVPAGNVILTNPISTNEVFISAAQSQGTFTFITNVITLSNQTKLEFQTNLFVAFHLGIISNSASATATLVVSPTVLGTLTNHFGVTANIQEVNTANNFATLLTRVVSPAPRIEPAGAQLAAESIPSSGIEPGERVTVSFALRNTGSLATSNLQARLLSGSGIDNPTASVQTFGVIAPFGQQVVSMPFDFTATGVYGGTITAVLELFDSGVSLGQVSYQFVLGGSQLFANNASILIRDNTTASPYPSTIQVSGLSGVVNKITVSLNKFTHTYPSDVNVLLVSPDGRKIVLMANAGDYYAVNNLNLTFDQQAAGRLPSSASLSTGSYLPSNYGVTGSFTPPAPAAPYAATLDVVRGINPNGVWSLYVLDDVPTESGFINNGWSMSIQTVSPVSANASLVIAMKSSATTMKIGALLTNAIVVTNVGLNTATGVVLTNTLPPTANFVSAINPQGGFTNDNGVIRFDLGSIPVGSTAAVWIVTQPIAAGTLDNVAGVYANELDLNMDDNRVSNTVIVQPSQADVAIRFLPAQGGAVVGFPYAYTLEVINAGPETATAVTITNTLPAGFQFMSASAGLVSSNGGRVVLSAGTLETNASARFVVTVVPSAVGVFQNTAVVSTLAADSNLANNTASAAVSVGNPAPVIVSGAIGLAQEGNLPNNGAIDPGESVVVNFALRNQGTAATTALVASMQPNANIILTSGPQSQNYGVVPPDGRMASRPFSFKLAPSATTPVTVTFDLTDNNVALGTVTFVIPISTVSTYSTPANSVIVIREAGEANPYPSTINVSGFTQSISKVSVTLKNLSHTFVSDVSIWLKAPDGQKVMLMSHVADGYPASDLTLTFDDFATNSMPKASALASGSYLPTDYLGSQAQAGAYSTSLSAFRTVANPNGAWSLYVYDNSNGDGGMINGGWSLTLAADSVLPQVADLAVVTSISPNPLAIGDRATFTVVVTNYGPSTVSGVVLTNLLPAGFNFNTPSLVGGQNLQRSGNTLVGGINQILAGQSVTLTIDGVATQLGTWTNRASVVGLESDPELSNNALSSLVAVVPVPALEVSRENQQLRLAWPAELNGYRVEAAESLNAPITWMPMDSSIIISNKVRVIEVGTTNTALFFRLVKP